jgi:hypothetical protein
MLEALGLRGSQWKIELRNLRRTELQKSAAVTSSVGLILSWPLLKSIRFAFSYFARFAVGPLNRHLRLQAIEGCVLNSQPNRIGG